MGNCEVCAPRILRSISIVLPITTAFRNDLNRLNENLYNKLHSIANNSVQIYSNHTDYNSQRSMGLIFQ